MNNLRHEGHKVPEHKKGFVRLIHLANVELPNAELLNAELLNAELLNVESY